METWLENWLHRLTWLNLSSPGAVAEASAHIAGGMVVLLLAYAHAGHRGAKKAMYILLAYSIYKEYFEDEHWGRLLAHTESVDEAKDFVTDLLTRLLPLILVPRLLPREKK